MQIPNGISFGSKVLVVAGCDSWFRHSGELVGLMEAPLRGQGFRWVKRGDPIAEFRIHGSVGDSFLSRWTSSELHTAPIRCPASGLVLHGRLNDGFAHYLANWHSTNYPGVDFAILLPDDEPTPESAEYVYSPMCHLIRKMSHYYFKKSRSMGWSAFSPDKLEGLLKLQLGAQPKLFDALPFWSSYFDEARTDKPELRPYLKHLVHH